MPIGRPAGKATKGERGRNGVSTRVGAAALVMDVSYDMVSPNNKQQVNAQDWFGKVGNPSLATTVHDGN